MKKSLPNPAVVAPPNEAAVVAARAAGLRYVSDRAPGWRRERAGKGYTFRYRDAAGKIIREPATLARVRKLAIPPAWTDVWISPQAHGHIQATGRDARGRKQYRYHAEWRTTRDETKFARMIAFGRALPRIRRRVARDLRARGLGREKILATMVRLLEVTHIRVGNEEYARENHSFGLSTLRNRHVAIRGGTLKFHFLGKSGKTHDVELHDARLAKIVRESQELPGQELFQYVDEGGTRQKVSSEDVNAYLREAAGEEFSAKDFRTWSGTVLAALALCELAALDEKPTKKNLAAGVERVAAQLGNTPAICRKSYIHPAVIDGYLAGEAILATGVAAGKSGVKGALAEAARTSPRLAANESAVLAFLKRKLRAPRPPLATLLRRSLRGGRSALVRRK